MPKYKRISIEEREEISIMLEQGLSLRAIARSLDRHVSSISREISRSAFAFKPYRATTSDREATKKASSRRKGCSKIKSNSKLQNIIKKKLQLFWSPEQIAVYLKKTYQNSELHVSKETIYSYIYVLPRGELRRELTDCLRQQHKKRKVRGRSAKGQTSNLEDMLSIEERPKEVEDRTIPGHWEGDIIIGGGAAQTALGTLVERTTRYVLLVQLKSKKAVDVRKAFAREVKKLPEQLRLSLTYDQGREMAQHKLFTEETKMQVYFAHPRSPWERGTNENTNMLIRQFFPKGIKFTDVSRYKIKKAQKLLNERPRKSLDFRTPYEAMQELLQ